MLGVVTGLASEARWVRPLPARAGGGTVEGAEAAAAALVAAGATALLSFGLAAGLAPGLAAGALAVPRAVEARGRRWEADAGLLARLGGPTVETVAEARVVLADPAAKRALFETSGSAAADLESGAVACQGVPFAVLRAVSDGAGDALPPAALCALAPSGAIVIGAVLGSLLRHPAQLPALLRLARGSARARQTLTDAVRPLLSGFP